MMPQPVDPSDLPAVHPRCTIDGPHGAHNTADSEGAKLNAGHWCRGRPPEPATPPQPGPELSAALQAEAPEPRLSGPDLCQVPNDYGEPVCVRTWDQRPCRTCPRWPNSATSPAQQPHDAPAGDGGHPGTPDGPAVLGRALLDDRGNLWRWWGTDFCWRSGGWYQSTKPAGRQVLLVRPEVGRVLEAVRAWGTARDAWTDDPEQPGVAQAYLAAELAMAAAVDALDQPTEVRLSEGSVEGPAAERVSPAILAAMNAPSKRTTGGPDHDGLTGAPIPPLDLTEAEREVALAEVEGRKTHADTVRAHLRVRHHNEAALGLSDREAIEQHRYEHVGPGTIRNHPPNDLNAEPAPEPAGDGPGWSRDFMDAFIDNVGDDESERQLRALLADRDRLERELEHARADRQDLWNTRDKRNHRWMEAAERYQGERDAARAELESVRVVLRSEAALSEERRVELTEVRAQLATVRENRDDQHAAATRLSYELDRIRADHLLIPKAGIVGYRLNIGTYAGQILDPDEVEIVLRGDLGQEGAS